MPRSQHRQTRLKKAVSYLRKRYWHRGGYNAVEVRRHFEAELRRWQNRDRPGWLRTTASTTCEQILEEALRQDLIIGAVDTEYFRGTGGIKVTEVGFSRLNPATGKVSTHHYVVSGGKNGTQKRFRYGASQYYGDLEALRQELWTHLSTVDCVLFWGKDADLSALRAIGVYVPTEKVVDAIELQKRSNYTRTGECYYNLKEFCEIQGVSHIGVHCAGNDSHALLTAVLHAVGVLGEELEGPP